MLHTALKWRKFFIFGLQNVLEYRTVILVLQSVLEHRTLFVFVLQNVL